MPLHTVGPESPQTCLFIYFETLSIRDIVLAAEIKQDVEGRRIRGHLDTYTGILAGTAHSRPVSLVNA